MTVVSSDDTPPDACGAQAMLDRSACRSDARLGAVIADLALDDALRLDEQARALVLMMLEQAVDSAARAIANGASRRDAHATIDVAGVFERLVAAGMMCDRPLIEAVIAAARSVLIDEALAATRGPDDGPTLLARLSDHADPAVRAAAAGYLLAESRRRSAPVPVAELPPGVERDLAWSVAVALTQGAGGDDTNARGIVDATTRYLDSRDPDLRSDAAARRLAAAFGSADEERGAAMIEALDEGRLALFAAIAARVAAVDVGEVIHATLDADPTVLLTILRAAALPREALALIGLRLSDADRGRDAEMLADVVDHVAAQSPADAARQITTLRLDVNFRAAMRRLKRAAR